VAGALIVWFALSGQRVSIVWLALPLAAFVILMVLHERLAARVERARRAESFFERALDRIDGKWAGRGSTGEEYLDPAHPYAQDLDLFGKGSLFELLSTARTHIGEETLARWLLSPADPATVRERQRAVEELRARVDLREDLAVVAEEARSGVDPVALAGWGEARPVLDRRRFKSILWPLTVLGLAGGFAVALLALNAGGLIGLPEPAAVLSRDLFLLAIAINGYFLYSTKREVTAVIAAVEEAAHELELLSGVLRRLEKERFAASLLARLRASLDSEGEPPSRRIQRLNRLMECLDSRDNVFVRVAEVFLLWTPHLALRIERWRAQSGGAVRRWITAAGEIEALCSLASHSFEHPLDPFPEFLADRGYIRAEGIAHPMLEESRAVRNSVRIGGELQLLVVSGSNMSGKSTLLRTLGVNAVLAQAGSTVRATHMVLSPIAVGASIRVSDSLQSGISRFYAEILRLRQILDATGGPLPVLFLIDEFLHGTNSHDRRIGAEAVVRGLVERGAIGAITTHDLALAEIADGLAPKAANVHFEDHIQDGRMVFDYVMRPGVVRKSNALELMRSVGLQI
jgi:hypothetical protein